MRWSAGAAAIGVALIAGASAAVSAVPSQGGGMPESQGPPRSFRMDPRIESRLNLSAAEGSQLGLTLRDLDAATRKEWKLPSAQGVLVNDVQPGGPADKGGIRSGDVISDFDGEHVRSIRQMKRLLGETLDGMPVRIGVVRDGRRLELSVTPEPAGPAIDDRFGELLRDGLGTNLRALPRMPPDPRGSRDFRPSDEWSTGSGRLGVVAQEVTPQLAAYFGASDGVLVASVTENSPAARAGLKAGDVVTAVGDTTVKSTGDLSRAIRAVPDGQEVAIALVRNRQARSVKVKLGGQEA